MICRTYMSDLRKALSSRLPRRPRDFPAGAAYHVRHICLAYGGVPTGRGFFQRPRRGSRAPPRMTTVGAAYHAARCRRGEKSGSHDMSDIYVRPTKGIVFRLPRRPRDFPAGAAYHVRHICLTYGGVPTGRGFFQRPRRGSRAPPRMTTVGAAYHAARVQGRRKRPGRMICRTYMSDLRKRRCRRNDGEQFDDRAPLPRQSGFHP